MIVSIFVIISLIFMLSLILFWISIQHLRTDYDYKWKLLFDLNLVVDFIVIGSISATVAGVASIASIQLQLFLALVLACLALSISGKMLDIFYESKLNSHFFETLTGESFRGLIPRLTLIPTFILFIASMMPILILLGDIKNASTIVVFVTAFTTFLLFNDSLDFLFFVKAVRDSRNMNISD